MKDIDEEVKQLRNDVIQINNELIGLRRDTSRSPTPTRSVRSQDASKDLKTLEDKCNKFFDQIRSQQGDLKQQVDELQ